MAKPHATRDERRELKNAHIEYRREGTALSRLFHRSDARRGLLVNISNGGVQFRTLEPLAEGLRLSATLTLPEVHGAPTLKLQVRWAREERRIGGVEFTHVVGARFIEYSPEAWHVLKNMFHK